MAIHNKKIEYLIVDSSAFINNVSIQEIGKNVLTVPEVINEIKSKRQIRKLVVLPYDLLIKEAFPENIKFVTDFSKKTGDYPSLSATDISVLALTYQIEKEHKGTQHLNSAPIGKPKIEPAAYIPEDLKNIAGFYLPKKGSKKNHYESSNMDSEDEKSIYDSAEEEVNDLEADFKECFTSSKESILEHNGRSENSEKKIEEMEHIKNYGNLKVNSSDSGEGKDENEDDWITPTNIGKIKKLMPNKLDENTENVLIACLTTDFAMQNVLKQIGLQVVSLDGKLIKQLRTFILRCYGCFKTTSIMTKVFCPNCGNKTLKKVAVSLNPDGTQSLHINFRKPLTARGKRFSLPRPKGGKHSNNPILCEDQPMPQQRPSRLSRTKNNPLNDDYIAGFSPFVTRDVTSKSAMLGIKPHVEMKYWMKKNPNEARRKKK